MSIVDIANGESGSSVRGKLNEVKDIAVESQSIEDISPQTVNVYDSFQRANGAVGNADSGQTPVILSGAGGEIVDKQLFLSTGGGASNPTFPFIIAWPLSTITSIQATGSFKIKTQFSFALGGSLIIAKDATNYIEIEFYSLIRVRSCIAGATSILYTSPNIATITGSTQYLNQLFSVTLILSRANQSSSPVDPYLRVSISEIPELNFLLDTAFFQADIATLFPLGTDVAYFGFGQIGNSYTNTRFMKANYLKVNDHYNFLA